MAIEWPNQIPPEFITAKKAGILRGSNLRWAALTSPALSCFGFMHKDAMQARPSSPDIVDFTTITDGMAYTEMAHSLTHWRYDSPRKAKDLKLSIYDMSAEFCTTSACVGIALRYGLGIPWASCIRGFQGLGVKANKNLAQLQYRIPRKYLAQHKPKAVVMANLHINPIGEEVALPGSRPGKIDYWAGMPGLVVITGWMSTEEILATPVYSLGHQSSKDWYYHLIDVMDLNPADTLESHEILKGLKADTREALNSREYQDIRSATPDICKYCLDINPRAEAAPAKPWGQDPGRLKALKLRPGDPWRCYHETRDRLGKYVELVILQRQTGNRSYRIAETKARYKRWRAQMNKLYDDYRLEQLRLKRKKKGVLSPGQQRLFKKLATPKQG
jgi:hypothetical protein